MGSKPYISEKDRKNIHDTDPIILYAKSIGKNTAEFDARNLRNYIRWLWQMDQKPSKTTKRRR